MAAGINKIIAAVSINYQWASPEYIDKMFYDKKDHHGLIYWYNEVERQHKAAEALNKPK